MRRSTDNARRYGRQSQVTREGIAIKMKGTRALPVFEPWLALVLCLLTTSEAQATPTGAALAAKIRSFEVLGVHLGMTPVQVDAALAKHGYSLKSADATSPNDLTHSGLCVNEYIGALRTGKPVAANIPFSGLGGNCVYWQQPAYRGNMLSGRNLLIYYSEDYPAHPGTMRVSQMEFSQPLQTDADAKAFRLALFSRMRMRPTWESEDQTTGSYCSLSYSSPGPNRNDSPCPVDRFGGFSIGGPGSQRADAKEPGVTLSYSAMAGGASLALQDRDFMIVHAAASNKAIEATRSPAKTPF